MFIWISYLEPPNIQINIITEINEFMVTHQWIIQTVNTRNANITVHQVSTSVMTLSVISGV